MIKKYFLFALIIFIYANVKAQKADTSFRAGYIYGDRIVYMLNAPKGWVFDNESGVPQNLPAVFYPKNSSFQNATTLMYSSFATIGKKKGQYKSLAHLIQKDSLMHKEESPATLIKQEPEIFISKPQKTSALIYHYKNAGNLTTEELTAYILYDDIVVIISMTAPNAKEYETNKYEFYTLVKSFVFISNSPKRVGKKK
jgi:hypothetical protein